MSTLYSSPFVLCESNMQKSHDKFIYQKIPFIHLSLVLLCAKKCFKRLVWGRLASEIKWCRQINLIETIRQMQNLIPTLDRKELSLSFSCKQGCTVSLQPLRTQHISMCVHKYWAVRWKRGPLHSGMGVPTLNAWVTDLSSSTSTLYKEEP